LEQREDVRRCDDNGNGTYGVQEELRIGTTELVTNSSVRDDGG